MEGMIGEIRMFGGNFAPRNWAFCQGQILAISTNTALFSILGTTYGGDGRTTFALPNLAGRVPVSAGHGPGLSDWQLGQIKGSNTNTLTNSNLANHTHFAQGSLQLNNSASNTNTPVNNVQGPVVGRNMTTGAPVQVNAYSPNTGAQMAADSAHVTLNNNGGNQPVNNIQPELGMNYIICMFGIFPSRG